MHASLAPIQTPHSDSQHTYVYSNFVRVGKVIVLCITHVYTQITLIDSKQISVHTGAGKHPWRVQLVLHALGSGSLITDYPGVMPLPSNIHRVLPMYSLHVHVHAYVLSIDHVHVDVCAHRQYFVRLMIKIITSCVKNTWMSALCARALFLVNVACQSVSLSVCL